MTTETSTRNVGVYLRISDDPDGTQTATARQLEDCRKYAAVKGWNVADVFEDVDLSAYQRTVRRPEFERLLAALRDGSIDGVLCWKIDRLSRRQRDLVRVDEQCEESGAFIASVVESLDTREPSGRFVAELLVSQARMESSNTSLRVKRASEEQARAGRPSLGGLRPYGYTPGREIVPEEAALIREAAERVLGGESLRGILADWEQRGVVTSTGKTWKHRPLRRTLMNATLSGQREYEGTLTKGTWPGILSPEETMRLRAIFNDPLRRSSRQSRKHLLSGMLRCGKCGAPLVARPRQDGVRRYVCGKQPGLPNCGRLARLAQPVEDVVRDAVIEALEGIDIAEYMKADDGDGAALVETISEYETRLEELSRDYYVDAVIERGEYFMARSGLQERLKQARSRLAQVTGRKAIAGAIYAGAELADQWDTRPLDWQRSVIDALIDHIVIHPAVKKGSNTFDPALIEPVWRA